MTMKATASKSVAIYARVSTERQAVDMQTEKLKAYASRREWEVYQVYEDQGFSGSNTKRPGFKQMLEDAHKRRFDVLLVWKLDRLSRSLQDLVDTLNSLHNYGIGFVSYSDQGIDTLSPTGKLLFHVMGAMAEFERDLTSERVKAGLENAKRKGKRLGRKPVLTTGTLDQIKKLKEEGFSNVQVAKKLKISEASVRNGLKRHND